MQLDNIPLESRDIPECHIKDFRWGPADDTYLILSREGQLFSGRVGETPSRLVNSDAVAGDIRGIGLETTCYIGDQRVAA